MSLRILKWLMTMADSEGVGPNREQLTTRNEKSLGCRPAAHAHAMISRLHLYCLTITHYHAVAAGAVKMTAGGKHASQAWINLLGDGSLSTKHAKQSNLQSCTRQQS